MFPHPKGLYHHVLPVIYPASVNMSHVLIRDVEKLRIAVWSAIEMARPSMRVLAGCESLPCVSKVIGPLSIRDVIN